MKYIKSKEWLEQHLDDRKVRIIDCRFSLSEPKMGQTGYLESHLPGAVFFDLEKEMSSPVTIHGGRHPLPELDEFVDKLQAEGIKNDDVIVAYDEGEGAFAARFWWLLSYLGHKNVFVLDGGFKNWRKGNGPVTTEIPKFRKSQLTVHLESDWLVDIREVKAVVRGENPNCLLIDSREEKRYLGLEETIDKKAGHIPGAINKPWFEGLNEGFFKPTEEQKRRFSNIDPQKEVIVYCGSGVTAIPNFLALKEAGYKHVKLYAGSFSDWISYDENKIEP